MANSGVTQTLESLIGPPSEVISVAAFLASEHPVAAVDAARTAWNALFSEDRALAEGDCRCVAFKRVVRRSMKHTSSPASPTSKRP